MLIIAIPKSASTSLMLTLKKYHNLKAKQDVSFNNNKLPEKCQFLYKMHSDVRELNKKNIKFICDSNRINKQHIYPSLNNISLLNDKKKVILLRPPNEVILAYRRAANKNLQNQIEGYSFDLTEEEWMEVSKSNGLYSDLLFFYEEWKSKAKTQNTLFIDYGDYLTHPQLVLNKIEEFYGLPITKEKVSTVKARFSRRSGLNSFFFKIKNKLKNAFFIY